MSVFITNRPSLTEAFYATRLLHSLDRYYPEISHWYVNTVLPGIYTGDDKILIARKDNHIVGLALGKRGVETKLRCIRVVPQYQHSGLGIRLIDRMLEEIEAEKPLATVSEELIHSYSRIFVRRYGFTLSDVVKGKYRRSKLEYVFN